MGILLVHTEYANPNYFAKTYGTVLGSYDPIMGTLGPGYACQNGATSCTRLPTTDADQAYYFIQTPNLPLLAPLRAIPLIGKPLADLVQPFLKVIVNLGYADPARIHQRHPADGEPAHAVRDLPARRPEGSHPAVGSGGPSGHP